MGVTPHGSKFGSTPIEADSNMRFAYGLFSTMLGSTCWQAIISNFYALCCNEGLPSLQHRAIQNYFGLPEASKRGKGPKVIMSSRA